MRCECIRPEQSKAMRNIIGREPLGATCQARQELIGEIAAAWAKSSSPSDELAATITGVVSPPALNAVRAYGQHRRRHVLSRVGWQMRSLEPRPRRRQRSKDLPIIGSRACVKLFAQPSVMVPPASRASSAFWR